MCLMKRGGGQSKRPNSDVSPAHSSFGLDVHSAAPLPVKSRRSVRKTTITNPNNCSACDNASRISSSKNNLRL